MPSRRRLPSRDIALLAPFWEEELCREMLPNGLTVIIKPDHSAALVSAQVWVKTGSIHEGSLLGCGVSHFLEHMLFKGTAKRSGREISAEVQAHGGYINAYTSFDRTVYYIDLPSEHLRVALDVLGDAVLSSTLPEDELARERNVILREIAMSKDDPEQKLGESLFETAFRAHPYRYPILGYKELFSSVGRTELEAYYRARYVPGNMVVVVVGDVDPERALDEVRRCFGSAPRTRLAPVLVPDEPVQLASRSLHRSDSVEVCRAFLSWRIPGLTHSDAPLLDLLGTVLGAGESSVLWQSIREKQGLVHSIDAHAWNPGDPGLFTISFVCDPGKRAEATKAIHAELQRIRRGGVPATQIARAVRQLTVGEINTRKTMAGQAARLGAAEVVVGDLHYSRGFFERIGAAGSGDLKRILTEHLLPSAYTEVSSNPAEAASKAPRKVVRPDSGDFVEHRLRNGTRLLIQPDNRLPNLHLRLVCAGGPMHEARNRRGACSLLATLLTKDTKRRSAAQVASHIESVGGSFYPFSGNNSLGLAVEVLPGDVERALRTLGEGAFTPAFAAESFKTERDAQLAELKLDADDIVVLGRKMIRRQFFGEYPLSIDAHGDEASLTALRTSELKTLHRQLFRSGNLVLAVSGAFRPKDLVPKLEALLESAPAGAPLPAPAPFAWPDSSDREVVLPREQAIVFHAFPGAPLLSPDFYVSEVADELFSGMASRLFERIREEKGLAYFVRSARVIGVGGAMFYFYAGTAPGKTAEVSAEIDQEVERVASGGVSAAELKRCIVRLHAARRQSMQTAGARAFNAALNVLHGLPANDWRQYDERVASVTAKDLASFAGRYLASARRSRLIVHP